MPRGRGGRRTPSNPAPVSGPGALSQRTDGGPAQPIRSAPMDQHGERGMIEGAQQAAPLPDNTRDGPLGPANMVGGGGPPQADVFGPMTPGEEGAPMGENFLPDGMSMLPPDPDEALLALVRSHPLPGLLRMAAIAGYGEALGDGPTL